MREQLLPLMRGKWPELRKKLPAFNDHQLRLAVTNHDKGKRFNGQIIDAVYEIIYDNYDSELDSLGRQFQAMLKAVKKHRYVHTDAPKP